MRFTATRGGGRSASDWTLLIGAAAAQVIASCALRALPLPTVRAGAARLGGLARVVLPGTDDRVLWAVEATGRRLAGFSSCLVRAVVVEARLREVGRPLQLTVGVKRSSAGNLQSHAWVAGAEGVLIGGPIDADMVPIAAWESACRL
jgi:Transglutaminase-like superfamily